MKSDSHSEKFFSFFDKQGRDKISLDEFKEGLLGITGQTNDLIRTIKRIMAQRG